MASQVSLPSMLFPPAPREPWIRIRRALRPGARRQRLGEDSLEQVRLDVREDERRDVDALLREVLVGVRVERPAAARARLVDPGFEPVWRDGLDIEMHAGEAVPAEH